MMLAPGWCMGRFPCRQLQNSVSNSSAQEEGLGSRKHGQFPPDIKPPHYLETAGVLSRIVPHVENSTNFNRFQSAYRLGYSTESTILRMLNDVYCAADGKRRLMIVLFDLSAAFDTIDIDTLLWRLEQTFGITGLALLWLQTYLEDRLH